MSKKNGTTTANTTQTLEFQFPQPKEKQSLGQFLYNSKEGTYLGRTPGSWGKILFFYAIFYTVLAGMMSICLMGLFSTLNETEPKWQQNDSLIGTTPGLGYRPLSEETKRGSLIHFDTTKPESGQLWIDLMDDFVKDYNATGKKVQFCSFDQTHDPQKVCVVDVKELHPCTPEGGYGYRNGRPCVLLKLNKIFNWQPDYYDDPNDLPEDMPADLKQHIANSTERRQIWVSCREQLREKKDRKDNNDQKEKKNTEDGDHILGEVKYYPSSRGFPGYYYPFLNQPGYMSPLVAVQFEMTNANASSYLHNIVDVECRAWAKNIIYNKRDRKGSVTFSLLID